MQQLARTSEIHLRLPIAPHANHRLHSAGERTLPQAMVPAEAITWLKELCKGGKTVTTIELNGPGDALASWPSTRTTLEMLKEEAPDTPLSLTCLGLGCADLVDDMVRLGVSRVTLLVDTVNPETAKELYTWIRPGKKTVPLLQGIELLLSEQAAGVKSLSEAGIKAVIQTRVHKNINDRELAVIAQHMSEQGAAAMELAGDGEELEQLADTTAPFLDSCVVEPETALPPPCDPQSCSTSTLPQPDANRPNVAVASIGGMDVDLHLGQAAKLLIYGPRDDGLACLLETRHTPPAGSPDRWLSLANSLSDCFALLATHAGEVPRKQLAEKGIKIVFTDGQIDAEVDAMFGGGKKRKCKK